MSHPLSINMNGILPVRGRPFPFHSKRTENAMKIDASNLSKALACGTFILLCETTRRLENSCDANFDGTIFFFRRGITRARLAAVVCGFASRTWARHYGDGKARWPNGLWIGNREVEVRIVRSGTAPGTEYLLDLKNNLVEVRSCGDSIRLVQRLFGACNAAFQTWERLAVSRAFKRERPVIRLEPVVGSEPVAIPKRRRKCPSERLSAAENARVREDFDLAAAKILGEPLAAIDGMQPETLARLRQYAESEGITVSAAFARLARDVIAQQPDAGAGGAGVDAER